MSDSKIKVAIRSRPLLKNEEPAAEPMSFHNGTVVKTSNKSFTYDYVFPPMVTNEAVYKLAVANKIQHLFNGYNVTILAYGSTGSGKTYTMGTDYNPRETFNSDLGIIPQGITEIFRVLEEGKESKDFSVKVTFLELYREIVYDLLCDEVKTCAVREDTSDGNFVVPDLTKLPVRSIEEAFDILTKGSNIRHTSATAKNLKSSRSHAIFSVYVEQMEKATLDSKRAKFQLVDLAGSERMASSKTKGVQVKEGININLGLLSLGKVISSLCEEKKHVPYRESNLTRLLQDSLGGNSHTVMIACVNPSSTSVEETMSTLRYASNTRKIKNRPVVNIDPPAVQIEKLQKQVKSLQAALDQQQPLSSLPSDSKSARLLQSAYARIGSLNLKVHELEERNSHVTEKLKLFYEEIKIIVSDITIAEAGTDAFLKKHLENLQLIESQCLQIMVQRSLIHSVEGADISSQDKTADNEESCKSALSSEIEFADCTENLSTTELSGTENLSTTELSPEDKRLFEEIVEEQRSCASNLDNVQRTLEMKEDMARHMQDIILSYQTDGDEERERELTKQLRIVTKEKMVLQDSLGKTEKFSKEMQEKVDKYEAQIKNLEDQLRRNTKCMQVKKESQAKMDILQKEIRNLKQCKVQIIKQMKENTNKNIRVQRQKDKDIAKLEREGRKKDIEFTKMKTKFGNQMRVLQTKVSQATVSKTKLLHALQKKKPGQAGVKAKQSQESLKDWVEEELKIVVSNGIVKMEVESLENLAEKLKGNLKKLEQMSTVVKEEDEQPSHAHKINADLQVILEQISDMNQYCKEDRSSKKCLILDGITDLQEAKHVIEFLFNKSATDQLEAAKQLEISAENLRNEQAIKEAAQETIQDLSKEIKSLKDEMDKLKLEKEKDMLDMKWKYESKEFSKINKGKKSKWLYDLSNLPEVSTDSESQKRSFETFYFPEEENKSMMEEYLCDESFSNDKNDPDWRLTPLHKRAKRERFEKKTIHAASKDDGPGTSKMEVIVDSSVADSESTLKNCDCAGMCKTMRCGCRKRGGNCSDSCTCDRNNCLNIKYEEKITSMVSKGCRDLPPVKYPDYSPPNSE